MASTGSRRRFARAAALCAASAALVATAPSASAMSHGSDTRHGAAPWMATLAFPGTDPLTERGYCGGTLIAPDRVLTAGHCVQGKAPADFQVYPGARPAHRTGRDGAPGQGMVLASGLAGDRHAGRHVRRRRSGRRPARSPGARGAPGADRESRRDLCRGGQGRARNGLRTRPHRTHRPGRGRHDRSAATGHDDPASTEAVRGGHSAGFGRRFRVLRHRSTRGARRAGTERLSR